MILFQSSNQLTSRKVDMGQQTPTYLRIAEGDASAFAQLHTLYKDRLLYYGKRFLNEWEDVKDVVADAFVQLWLSRAEMQSDAHLANFLYRVVRHKAIDRQENIKRQELLLRKVDQPELAEENQLEAEQVRVEMIHLLSAAVDALPAQYKRVFELSYHQECSPAEIARILQMNPDTVRSQKRRAIEMIRTWVNQKTVSIRLFFSF